MSLIDAFLHVDLYLKEIVISYGLWTYLILFSIVFCETGLVVTPFLPGDSLLFAAGAISSISALRLELLLVLLSMAAILGDSANYFAGLYVGSKILSGPLSRFVNRKYLERTHEFYERHGGKTIVLARFIPIVRTFAPFVAGMGRMSYGRFVLFNILGGIFWVLLCTLSGYFFGNIPFVKENFSLVILAIVFISILPALASILSEKVRGRRAALRP